MPLKSIFILLLIVLAAVVVCSGLSAVYQTEYASGWDGYYYLVQVQSLNNTGVMHSPEYSLVYLPLLALHAVTNDYVASYKITAVLIKLLFIFSVFALSVSLPGSARDTGNRGIYFTALWAAALSAMSPSLNFFFTQFPKNLLGFAFFFYFMASVFGSSSCRSRQVSSKGRWYLRVLGSLLLFLAAFFTHRFSAVLSLCFLVLFFGFRVRDRLRILLNSARQRMGRILLFAAGSIVLLVTVLLISHRLPLAPSVHDLERITGDLSSRPIFVPLTFVSTFGTFRLTMPWLVEVLLAGVLPLVTCLMLLFRRFGFLRVGRNYYILLIISLFGLFPFLRFSLTGLSYRLFFGTLLMFPVILVPYIRLAALGVLKLRPKGMLKPQGVLVLIFAVMLSLSFITAHSYRPEIHDPPYGLYEEIAGEAVDALSDLDCELIIAHRSLAEMITFRYEVDALPWAPEEYFPRDRVWRITAGILRDEISYYLSPGAADSFFIRLSGDYGLLREDQWEAFLLSTADSREMNDAVDTWRNPLDRRPVYLIKNR